MTIKRQLYVVTFLIDATCGAFVFAVGRLLAEESASLLSLGVVGAGAAAGWAIVALPAGQLSDRCGRRFTALLGASLLLICTVGSLVFQNFSAPEPEPELALPPMTADQRLSVAFGRMCWVANIAGTCCVGIVMYLLSDLAVALDVSAPGQGLILGVMRVAVMVTYLVMHSSDFWHHRLKVIIGARLLGLAGLAVVCVATGSLGLLIGLSSLGCMLGFNYFSSLYYATSGSSDCRRGRACAVVEFTVSLGVGIGTLLGGVAGEAIGVRAPYQAAFVVVVVMFILELLVFLFYVAPVHAAAKIRIPDTSNKDK